MLKALHGWYQWKAEIESNLEVPSIQSTFWVMWRKFNIKLSHSVFTWPLFVRKCLFFQTNQPFTQTCDICTHIVSYMVGKLLKRSTFLRTQLHSYDANLKSYEFIPHAGISYMWDLTPHHRCKITIVLKTGRMAGIMNPHYYLGSHYQSSCLEVIWDLTPCLSCHLPDSATNH